jgi:hypothetical protein
MDGCGHVPVPMAARNNVNPDTRRKMVLPQLLPPTALCSLPPSTLTSNATSPPLTSLVRSSTHTTTKKPSCSSKAALPNSWFKSTQICTKIYYLRRKNQALLYVKLSKAIYGLLKSALLFYNKIVADLQNYKAPFVINRYDPCVANAIINGKQMTITWHVDDLKVLHVDPFQITKFAAYLASIYSNGLVVHHGKVHNYLGMDLNFANKGVGQISMITYTTKILTDFPKAITTSCATPAANHLFTVHDKATAKFLPETQTQAFHHTVAQLLFLCKQT